MTDSKSHLPEMCQRQRLARRRSKDVPRPAQGWIWEDWIPRGALSVVLGELAIGKSFLAMELAAMVSRGWTTLPSAQMRLGKTEPDIKDLAGAKDIESGEQAKAAGPTVILFGSLDTAPIMLQRLEAAGADLENVSLVERIDRGDDDLLDAEGNLLLDPKKPKAPTRAEKDRDLRLDLLSLEQHILLLQSEGHDVPLVIIDPIETLLREALDPARFVGSLNKLAQRTGAAIVAVGLIAMSSRYGFKIQTRGIETLVQVAPTVLTIVPDLEDKRVRLVLPTKLTAAADQPGRKFRVQPAGHLEWSEELFHLNTEEYLIQAKERRKDPLTGEANSELRRVTTWLKERLNDGEVLSIDVRMDAHANEISGATLRRAFKLLGCRTNKQPVTGKWSWRLPGTAVGGSPASHDGPATGGFPASRDGSRIDESFARCEVSDDPRESAS